MNDKKIIILYLPFFHSFRSKRGLNMFNYIMSEVIKNKSVCYLATELLLLMENTICKIGFIIRVGKVYRTNIRTIICVDSFYYSSTNY